MSSQIAGAVPYPKETETCSYKRWRIHTPCALGEGSRSAAPSQGRPDLSYFRPLLGIYIAIFVLLNQTGSSGRLPSFLINSGICIATPVCSSRPSSRLLSVIPQLCLQHVVQQCFRHFPWCRRAALWAGIWKDFAHRCHSWIWCMGYISNTDYLRHYGKLTVYRRGTSLCIWYCHVLLVYLGPSQGKKNSAFLEPYGLYDSDLCSGNYFCCSYYSRPRCVWSSRFLADALLTFCWFF